MTKLIRTITIRYINGDEETFEYPAVLEDNLANMATNIQKLMDSEHFILNWKIV